MQWNKHHLAALPPWDDLEQESQIHLTHSSSGSNQQPLDSALQDEVTKANHDSKNIFIIAVDQALFLLSRITSRNRRE